MIQELDNSTVSRVERPVRVLQFGEGNFLRAFADWMLDIANDAGVTDTAVAIVKPRQGTNATISTLKAQDGLYHVILEGVENGKPRQSLHLVKSVTEVFTPDDTETFSKYILSPSLRFIISNTTEAGICYVKEDILTGMQSSFPGKVAAILWKRFNAFDGDPSKGLIFMPCELIEDNGEKLKDIILRHIDETPQLPTRFKDWVINNCTFVNTLVDRIVAGSPENTDELKQAIGYDDNAIVKGELYHLWAIGGTGAEKVKEELPLDKAGLNVLFMPSIKEFRERKVRILNGSHTGMVAMGLLAGCDTVADAYSNQLINKFLHNMMDKEVLPTIDGDQLELKRFANGILERFLNPYIKHHLSSIALNSLSKWEARNLDTARDNWKKLGHVANYETFTFAALMALYAPQSGFTPDDNPEHVTFIRDNWDDNDIAGTLTTILTPGRIFNVDFEKEMPGFTALASSYIAMIREKGIEKALAHVLDSNP
ncbi:MAG: tagaturonate reductase [Clostridiales bacterium]|nr:tagaturonate reductase [Clostridiales bacterium]